MVVHGCAWIDLRHAMMVDECDQSVHVLHRGQQRGALFTIINLFTTGPLSPLPPHRPLPATLPSSLPCRRISRKRPGPGPGHSAQRRPSKNQRRRKPRRKNWSRSCPSKTRVPGGERFPSQTSKRRNRVARKGRKILRGLLRLTRDQLPLPPPLPSHPSTTRKKIQCTTDRTFRLLRALSLSLLVSAVPTFPLR